MEPYWIQLVRDDTQLRHINPVIPKIMYGNGAVTETQVMNLSNDLIAKIRVSEANLRELFSGEM